MLALVVIVAFLFALAIAFAFVVYIDDWREELIFRRARRRRARQWRGR